MAKTIPAQYEHAERWAFGDNEALADELVQLILNGTKTATCSNLDEDGIPQAGDIFVVVDGRGEPACAIRLTSVDVRSYDQVDEAHAFAEGKATVRWPIGAANTGASLRHTICLRRI
ncbi:hypothetical protein GGER_22590 [Serratia rubidaea]